MALDTLYTAETPEGIALSLRPAGVVPRFQAFFIDLVIRFGLFLLASMVAGVAGGLGAGFLLIAYFCLDWLYPVVFELLPGGATPGKRAMGLQVVMDSGLPITPAASFVRNLLRVADFMPFLYAFGIFSMLARQDFKRLGDMAAGTLVVYSRSVSLHGEPPAVPAQAPVRALTLREQAAVVSWAGRAARLTPERLDELALLAQPITGKSAREDGGATSHLLAVAQWLLGSRKERA